jgi:putative heme-binding domain-containing protein
VPIPRNDLRVRPATWTFEPVAGFSQFGLPRDDWGDRFPSWNTVPIRHVVLETSEAAPGTRTVAEILDMTDGGRVYSLAPAQRRFNAETVAFFNATCGPTVYRGDLLGDSYRGHAFVCEPLTSVVHHRRLDPDGPTYAARRVEAEEGREFLASTHPWFRPVNLTSGPDGALYVADFCRPWVEHPAFVPEGSRHGVDFREGFNHGRIWRIAPRCSGPAARPLWPAGEDTAGLVALLSQSNAWQRDTAQRLLIERKPPEGTPLLRSLAAKPGPTLARTHALWTLAGLSRLDADTLRPALHANHPRLREHGARLAASSGLQAALADDLTGLAGDPDPRVRLRVAVALAAVPGDAALEALARVAAVDADSPWTSSALLNALTDRPTRFLDLVAARQPAWLAGPTPAQARFLERLGAWIGASVGPARVLEGLDRAVGARGEAAAFALLEGIAGHRAGPLSWPEIKSAPAPLRRELERVRKIAALAARDSGRPAWVRVRAVGMLIALRDPAAKGLIPELILPSQPPELQTASARGLAGVADPGLAEQLLGRWEEYTLGTRRVLLGVLSGEAPLAGKLLDAVAGGIVPATEIDPGTRDALRRLADPSLAKRLAEVLPAPPRSDRREVLGRYEPALTLRGEPARGRDLFAKHCQTCHARAGRGARVGPDLLSVAGRPPADLLVAILDPSREVAPDGLAVVVATTRGQTLTGLLVEETASSVRLRRAEGLDDVVPRAEVEAIRPTGRSLMPDGLEQVLSQQDVADLIAYLKAPEPPPAR